MLDQLTDWRTALRHVAQSDVGMRRTNNQDSFGVRLANDAESWRRRGHLFVVADGMGAHAAGELASKLAADNVPHLYQKYADKTPPEALERAIVEANAEIHRRGQANSEFHGMGTTCSALAVLPEGAYVAHVGDSRVYRMRNGLLEQLTFDHSLVWEMKAAGQLGEKSELAQRVPKNVITRSLGPNVAVQVDLEGPFPIEPGDVFLLCSDGLTGPVPDSDLAPILAHFEPEQAAPLLIDLANLRGGPDNVTAILVKASAPQAAAPGAAPASGGGWKGFASGLLGALGLKRGPGKSGRLGNGPYTNASGAATAQVCQRLRDLVQQLRDAARSEDIAIDWSRIDQRIAQGDQAAAAKRFSPALQAYGALIHEMMEDLRKQRKQRASDSTLNL